MTKAALTEAAWAASRTKGTYLSSKYKKLAARRGKKRAIVAIGHTILRLVYHILSDTNVRYRELGSDFADARQKQAAIKRHKKALADLGVELDYVATVSQ